MYIDNGLEKHQENIRQWLLIKDVPVTQRLKDIMGKQVAREAAHVAAFVESQTNRY